MPGFVHQIPQPDWFTHIKFGRRGLVFAPWTYTGTGRIVYGILKNVGGEVKLDIVVKDLDAGDNPLYVGPKFWIGENNKVLTVSQLGSVNSPPYEPCICENGQVVAKMNGLLADGVTRTFNTCALFKSTQAEGGALHYIVFLHEHVLNTYTTNKYFYGVDVQQAKDSSAWYEIGRADTYGAGNFSPNGRRFLAEGANRSTDSLVEYNFTYNPITQRIVLSKTSYDKKTITVNRQTTISSKESGYTPGSSNFTENVGPFVCTDGSGCNREEGCRNNNDTEFYHSYFQTTSPNINIYPEYNLLATNIQSGSSYEFFGYDRQSNPQTIAMTHSSSYLSTQTKSGEGRSTTDKSQDGTVESHCGFNAYNQCDCIKDATWSKQVIVQGSDVTLLHNQNLTYTEQSDRQISFGHVTLPTKKYSASSTTNLYDNTSSSGSQTDIDEYWWTRAEAELGWQGGHSCIVNTSGEEVVGFQVNGNSERNAIQIFNSIYPFSVYIKTVESATQNATGTSSIAGPQISTSSTDSGYSSSAISKLFVCGQVMDQIQTTYVQGGDSCSVACERDQDDCSLDCTAGDERDYTVAECLKFVGRSHEQFESETGDRSESSSNTYNYSSNDYPRGEYGHTIRDANLAVPINSTNSIDTELSIEDPLVDVVEAVHARIFYGDGIFVYEKARFQRYLNTGQYFWRLLERTATVHTFASETMQLDGSIGGFLPANGVNLLELFNSEYQAKIDPNVPQFVSMPEYSEADYGTYHFLVHPFINIGIM